MTAVFKTHWQPVTPWPAEPPKIDPADAPTYHHLVYAAMLDGCCSREALAKLLGISQNLVLSTQLALKKAGYIELGVWNSHRALVPSAGAAE